MNSKQLYCQTLKFNNMDDYFKCNKIYNNKNIDFIEFRVDGLLKNDYNIDEIIKIINQIDIKKQKIFTIRTESEGGDVKLNDYDYFDYIIKALTLSNSEYIDIEYNLYNNNKTIFDKYIDIARNLHNKKIIFSIHILDKSYSKKYYEDLIIDINNNNCDIIKIASKPFNKDDVINLMEAANSIKNQITDKKLIMISMGTLGVVSRVFTEYTNSYFTFIDENVENMNEIGQCSIKFLKHLRKLI